MKDNIIVGLDLGTSKIACIVADISRGNLLKMEIVGVGITESHGLRKGVVVNVEEAADSIRRALEEAELTAGISIDSVYAGITGGHIEGMTRSGVVAVSGKNNEITSTDLRRAIQIAKTCKITVDREIIHAIPQGFVIDEQERIKDPIGMYGVRLEAFVHVVTGAVALAQNIVKSAYLAGVSVENIVLEPLASGEAVLTREEKESGTLLIDIGGGSTDIMLYEDNVPMHTAVLPLGGQHVTNDISTVLNMPYIEAEALKIEKGYVMMDEYDMLERSYSRKRKKAKVASQYILTDIIQYRMTEILGLVAQEIENNCLTLPTGVVLTGGTSLLTGLDGLAENIFRIPVRIGYPRIENGLVDKVNSPIYATGVGLVLYGGKQRKSGVDTSIKGNLFEEIYKRMQNWFKEYF
ncbi:TPA: cell division protein FtsA [Candidatus Poribacteria bacterium]|nr:cell division protein FtsA [Candidatus Poribacteria bacterium]